MNKIIFAIFLSLICYISVKAQNNPKVISKTYFALCEREFGKCMPDKICRVDLISGSKITIGSYIKVYFKNKLMTEGYILKHTSGRVFILEKREDANNPEIYGGCADGYYEIFLTSREIWGC
jgi:hypothetical protein